MKWLAEHVRAAIAAAAVVLAISTPVALGYVVVQERAERHTAEAEAAELAEQRALVAEQTIRRLSDLAGDLAAERSAEHHEINERLDQLVNERLDKLIRLLEERDADAE